jgi:hypothetical protein
MEHKSLHIVCFDVPYPVTHGGFFDLFYKLKCLHEAGIEIYLHCFQYGRTQQNELNKYCKEVYYYQRKKAQGFSIKMPYIVSSRMNQELFKRLSADQHPILLEGTHCTYLLYKNLFPNRKIIFRLHNIEHIYYGQLFKWEKNIFKKLYFLFESYALKKYERIVAPRAFITLPVAQNDATNFKKYCPEANLQYLPLFIPFTAIKSLPGNSDYILYHGNLSIAENQQTVYWMLKELLPLKMRLVIAGRNPPIRLVTFIDKIENAKLIIDPPDDELEILIQQAHINIILAFNETGIKLKLLHALYAGRHCIANTNAVGNEVFKPLCHVADTAIEIKELITKLSDLPFTIKEIEQRESLLLNHFNNKKNAQWLSSLI